MKLLFTSGTARGGTNLRTLMLNNHPKVRMAIDPFIPLFRFYRDSLLKSTSIDPNSLGLVLDDYYFSDQKLRVMKAIQSAKADIVFDRTSWPELKEALACRMELASCNLIPYLDLLLGDTFEEVFRNTSKLVLAANGRSDVDLEWCGFNDNWAIEFFPLLAQVIPDAHFIVNLRDPRAVVNSSEFAEPEPKKHPTVLSFSRHLRKYATFAKLLSKHPALHGRLLVSRYEDAVSDPEAEMKRTCAFLNIEFDSKVLDHSHFRKADGSLWPSSKEIYTASADSWKEQMPDPMRELTEFICGPEMGLHGYQSSALSGGGGGLSDAAFAFAMENARECLGWNTDFSEIEHTIGCELFRKQMLRTELNYTDLEIERSFLSVSVFNEIKDAMKCESYNRN